MFPKPLYTTLPCTIEVLNFIDRVNDMDPWEKIRIYLHEYIDMMCLNNLEGTRYVMESFEAFADRGNVLFTQRSSLYLDRVIRERQIQLSGIYHAVYQKEQEARPQRLRDGKPLYANATEPSL